MIISGLPRTAVVAFAHKQRGLYGFNQRPQDIKSVCSEAAAAAVAATFALYTVDRPRPARPATVSLWPARPMSLSPRRS